MIKGFALDYEKLKQGNQLLGKDYFNELIEQKKYLELLKNGCNFVGRCKGNNGRNWLLMLGEVKVLTCPLF